ncbi:hypothetical protein K469DRAFT_710409 [Zopfia rhizophila CBS 207.26]|uniref:Membrane-associated proteins in eicosanoid and glutathione metabolism n=1 Tax=Zopfia rhizophila CBS 207.26 TaxID=1314779 RepID=A0A6A6DVA1_9PEZI|nr:hypothetical protein K469DRAFT_710409 [Zopfia rhizophila CBS 207.26]
MASFIQTLSQSYNLSILCLPAYHLLAMAPHAYAVSLGARAFENNQWDNRNPRSSTLKSTLQQRLSADIYARYERAEACSANGFENLPLFAAAIVLGNIARLGDDFMNMFALSVLVVRSVYSVVYVRGVNQGWAWARSLFWGVFVGLCWNVLIKASKSMAGK